MGMQTVNGSRLICQVKKMCLSWLRKWFCYPNMPKPEHLSDIASFEITTLLRAAFPNAQIFLSDNQFKTVPIEELKKYIKYDITDAYKYTNEYYDCDDFSFALMGSLSNPKWGCLPFGIVYVGTMFNEEGNMLAAHAVNIFIDPWRKIWVIEPQNDRVFEMPDNWIPYLIFM